MSQRAKELVEKFMNDKEFRKKVSAAGNPTEQAEILKEHGFGDVSQEEVESFTGISADGANSGELSDDELEAVAGGRAVEWAAVVSAVAAGAAAG